MKSFAFVAPIPRAVVAGIMALLVTTSLAACGAVTLSDEVVGCEVGEKKLTFGFFSTHALPDLTLSPTEYDGVDFLMEVGARGTSPDYTGIKLAEIAIGNASAESPAPVYRKMEVTTYNEGVLCLDSAQPVALFVRGTVTLTLDASDVQPMLTYDRFECDINEAGKLGDDGLTPVDGPEGESKNLVTAHRDLGGEDYIKQNYLSDGFIRIGVQCNYTYTPAGWTGPAPRSYGSISEETGGMVT
jgi:hypothetical protein